MYEPKTLDFGCVILCPDQNARSLFITARSVGHFTKAPCIAVVPKGTKRVVTDEIKKTCDFARGSNTYTSLINAGLQKSKQDWNFIIFAGSTVKPKFWTKYTSFLNDEMDVIYPIMTGHTNFVDGSLNGILIHKNIIKRVGKIPEISEIEQAKSSWAYKAIQKKYRFVGLLNSSIN